jgi:hypothetical protein
MVPGMMVLGEDGAKPVRSADMAEEEPERRRSGSRWRDRRLLQPSVSSARPVPVIE